MKSGFHYAMTIDGNPVQGAGRFDVLNPANEKVIAEAPDCSRQQLDDAVAAARRAFRGWAATPIATRRTCLQSLAQAILDNADAFMRLITAEQGKPHADSQWEAMASGQLLQAQISLNIPNPVAEDTPERKVETRYVPIGVVGAITPWNFPLAEAIMKIGPALLTGNTVVLKPSPFTPLSTLKLGELSRDILPPGVLNVVSGGDELGPWLTSHPGIGKVTFTGSSHTGRRVMESASATLKRVTLELGGNDAAIVLPDVDVDRVAVPLFWSAFNNNGQLCIATKRLYIHEDIYDRLTAALVAYARTVKVGDGAEPGVQLGPLNNRPQYRRVLNLIEDARARGLKFLLGGENHTTGGYFVPITLIDNPPQDSRIVREEQFGPVLPLLKFSAVEQVIAQANNSDYGLAGSVWSGDDDQAFAIAQQLETGTVFINQPQYTSPFAPFGGHKQSGLGCEGGIDGLLAFMNPQTTVRHKTPAVS